jgi:hypothetical protein
MSNNSDLLIIVISDLAKKQTTRKNHGNLVNCHKLNGIIPAFQGLTSTRQI